MVLLDALVHRRLAELMASHLQLASSGQLIVAHFDHGIREDSAEDMQLVRGVAERHGLTFESRRVELGKGVSEEAARTERYNFLRQCCKKYNAQLVTAHHQDDVIETMIINLIRGTGWRGLAPMGQILDLSSRILDKHQKPASVVPAQAEIQSSESSVANQIHSSDQRILRPLLGTKKSAIKTYAKKYDIKWREDSTNQSPVYLRNYVRLQLIPKMIQKDPASMQKLLDINQAATSLKNEIATELQNYLINYQLAVAGCTIPRYELIMLPSSTAREVLYNVLTSLDPQWHPRATQIEKSLHFVKTGQSHKTIEVSGHLTITLTTRDAQFKKV